MLLRQAAAYNSVVRLRFLLLVVTPVLAGELDEAKRLLDQTPEGDVRRGVEACAKANNVEGADALLEVLRRTDRGGRLAPAHYRDMVWEGLLAITDPYARARVERELRTNRKNAPVRMWCAELLGIWGDAAFAPALIGACSDGNDGVKQWAARSLGMLRHEPATKALEPLTRDSDPFVRANSLEALARIDPAGQRERFLSAIERDADGGVRCALLGALPAIYPDAALAASAARGHDDEDWRPRMQAVDNLAAIRKKESVDALVERSADGRPVVQERAMEILRKMTGKEIRDARGWGAWWGANRETFVFPEGEGPGEGEAPEHKTVAYGIPLVSDHVAFLIDASARMADRLQATGTSKADAAREELSRVLGELHGRLVFNVYTYREDIDAFRKKPVALDPKQQKKAEDFVKTKTTAGAKDIWNVLETVVSDPDIDTVYLLSSGEPDVGLYVHWNRVTSHLADLNRFHKVVVHTVVYSERQWFRDQLQKIAEATGGKFKWFQ